MTMKRKSILPALFLIVYSSVSFTQNVKNTPIFNTDSEKPVEHITLLTDRTLYATTETINFKANYTISLHSPNKWSTVLYVELIKTDGTPVIQNKFPLNNASASGSLVIPKNLITGIYYIKAYTKWMRNFEVEKYAYKSVKIINPKNSNILAIDIDSCISFDHIPELQKNSIRINTDKETYKPRDSIEVSLNKEMSNNSAYYNIAVVKKGANTVILERKTDLSEKTLPKNNDIKYLPEIDGITLSGQLVNSKTKAPVNGADVHLILLNDQPYLSGFRSKPDGRFYFKLPYMSDNKDFFITAGKDELDYKMNIDSDFCERPVNLCPEDFKLNKEEKDLALEISINIQLASMYKEQSDRLNNQESDVNLSFYGTPNRSVYTEKYIDLPYIEEFIFELVPEISILHRKGTTAIRTKQKNTFSPFPMLVLIDNIPITDLATFLKLRTNKVERIEVVDNAYIVGGLKYNGVVNAITNNRDLAGIELPQNSMFFNYKMFSGESVKNDNVVYDNRIPDRRNCLYWNPNFTVKTDTDNQFSFYCSDLTGIYQIVVQTVSDKGEVLTSIKEFVVE